MKKIADKVSSVWPWLASAFLSWSPGQVLAVNLQAELTLGPSVIQSCGFKQATLDVDLAEAFDELLISVDFAWLASDPQNVSCLGSQIEARLNFEEQGGERYIIPLTLDVGAGDGQIATSAVSPRWDQVVCWMVSPSRRCFSETQAKALLSQAGRISGFNIERVVVQKDAPPVITKSSKPASSAGGIDIEAMLEESIDSVLGKGRDTAGEQEATQRVEASGDLGTRSMIGPALRQFKPAPSNCEQNLRVDYSAGSSGPCLIELEAVTRFEPQCPVQSGDVRRYSRVALNLTTRPVDEIAVVTLPNGPVMLSISLKEPWVDQGTHLSNQWALSAAGEHAAKLEALAQELISRQDQCAQQ